MARATPSGYCRLVHFLGNTVVTFRIVLSDPCLALLVSARCSRRKVLRRVLSAYRGSVHTTPTRTKNRWLTLWFSPVLNAHSRFTVTRISFNDILTHKITFYHFAVVSPCSSSMPNSSSLSAKLKIF